MPQLKKAVHILLGGLLIAIGIAGLVLPVLNGMLFLLIGLILLSFESAYVESNLRRLAHRNKFLSKWYERLSVWMKKHL